jgi:NADH:ubiquinone oxidoreductase subunit 2 (subunit N)
MTPNIGLLGLLGGALDLRGGAGLLGALVLPRINYTAILPELILIGGALLLLGIGSLFRDELPTAAYAGLAVGLSVASLVVSLVLYHDVTARQAFTTIDHSVSVDGFGAFVAVLVSAILLVASLAAVAFLERERIVGPEYYALA